MKRSLIVAALAVLGLGGCVAVPVYDGGPGYGYSGPAYYGPPVSFSFGYTYQDGPGRGYRHRGHRHWR